MSLMSISQIYSQLYEKKFKKNKYIHIDSGFITSKKVYLDLDDIDLIDGLGNILDFYRSLDNEGATFRLNFSSINRYSMCRHINRTGLYCIDCNLFFCDLCNNNAYHEKHRVEVVVGKNKDQCLICKKITRLPLINKEDKLHCYNCFESRYENESIVTFNKPVIAKFNLYEWIPMSNFLENRNPNSHMFNRKIHIIKKQDHIELSLIHHKATFYNNYKTIILLDILYRILDHYKIPPYIDDDIVKLILKSGIKYN